MRKAMRTTKLFVVDRPIDPLLGVTAYVSDWTRRHGFDPTFLFRNVRGSTVPVVMNLLKREVILASMGVADDAAAPSVLADRLERPGDVRREESLAERELASLDELPILQHQPRDAGRYLTSFVGSLRNNSDGSTNLGFYRALVSGERELVLFMDPRTHAHRICEEGLAGQAEVPITLFNGGPLSTYLAAAAKLPYDFDSFEAASRLGARPLSIDRTAFPPAPAEAEIVLHGFVTRERRDEGPFGEFKGYYCPRTRSPVVRIERVLLREDAHYLGLFCGKESGLTLMALQNEILMLAHLRGAGFPVVSVRYPLTMFGEYAAIIVSTDPSQEMVRAAMDFDPRSKIVIVTELGEDVLREAAVFPAEADMLPYMRRGHQEGHRIGLLCRRTTDYDWVEY